MLNIALLKQLPIKREIFTFILSCPVHDVALPMWPVCLYSAYTRHFIKIDVIDTLLSHLDEGKSPWYTV